MFHKNSFMKNLNIKSVAFLTTAALMAGCGENAWNDHLDGFEEPPVYSKTETIDYTLTAADYSSIANNSTNKAMAEEAGEADALKAVGANGCFASAEQARKYIPAFISGSSFPYFALNDGSSLRIGYDLSSNQPEEVKAIDAGVKLYTVSEADYQEAWGSTDDFIKGFAPATPASASLANILKTQFPSANSGDFAVISYEEASVNPVFGSGNTEPVVYIDQPFSDNMDGFTLENVKLPEGSTYIWKLDNYGYMKASGYVGGKNWDSEGWLISSEVELSADANAVLTFEQAYNYFSNIATAAEEGSVNVREKGGQWVKLTVPTLPEKLGWTMVASGDIDLSAYNGKTIQIGFCYKSTAAKAGTWEVKNVKLMDGVATRSLSTRAAAAAVPTVSKNAIYKYEGSAWSVPGSMLVLQPADYAAMGQTRNNLSGTLPAQLLPTYLANALPYSSEDAAVIVAYNYSNGSSTSYRAKQFTKTEGVWVMNNGATVDKFTRKDGKWQFNPSVEMVLPYSRNTAPSSTYYMACKDWVYENISKKLYPDAVADPANKIGYPFIDYRDNAEFYSGASAYYGNVDIRANTAKSNAPEGYTGYDGLSDEQISDLILKRFVTESFLGALEMLDSNAETVAGMEVTYTFTFTAYTSDGTQEYVVEYLVIGKGQFEFRKLWKKTDAGLEEVSVE
jgi:hypothetical protein